MAAADIVNVLYDDTTQQPKTRQDLLAGLQYTQNVINTPIYMLDNHQERIVQAQIAPSAQMTAYVQRWIDANSKFQIPLN
jgi:malate synthase